jgi:hypothetical protein
LSDAEYKGIVNPGPTSYNPYIFQKNKLNKSTVSSGVIKKNVPYKLEKSNNPDVGTYEAGKASLH